MAREGRYAGPATIALTKQMREWLMERVRKGRPLQSFEMQSSDAVAQWWTSRGTIAPRARFYRTRDVNQTLQGEGHEQDHVGYAGGHTVSFVRSYGRRAGRCRADVRNARSIGIVRCAGDRP